MPLLTKNFKEIFSTQIILLVCLIGLVLFVFPRKTEVSNKGIVIITIDDISPAYSLESHEKLFSIIDKHNATATLFIIPDYMGNYPVTANDTWIELIKKEQNKGYEIAQHGYKHMQNEFALLNYSKSKENLLAGMNLLNRVFPNETCGFRPPYWSENFEVKKALKDLGYCYDADSFAIRFEHGWKTNVWISEFVKTVGEFITISEVHRPFIIVLHVQAMTPEGYKYLDEFLSFAEKEGAVFKTYKEVYGENLSKV